MVTFSVSLAYQDEDTIRPIAQGCSKEQLLDVLSRHLLLAEVSFFMIFPSVDYVPFKEYTL